MASAAASRSFVRWFRQVAPYVHAFRGRTFVVAFGGEMFAERARFASFIHDVNLLAALGIRLVLVHGARPQIEAELKAKGLRSRYAQGLRVTDEQALQAVKHAAGVLRVEIEALLSQGLPNSPMARAQIRVASGNYITARPIGVRKGVDFQFTGAVRKVDAAAHRRAPRRRATSCWCRRSATRPPARCSTSPGKTSPRASPWRSRPTSCSCTPTGCRPTARARWSPSSPRDEAADAARQEEPTSRRRRCARSSTLARAVEGGVARGHLVTRRAAGSLLLELFTHAGVGTMITADTVEKLRAGAHRGRARHARADRAARGRGHAGEAQPRAARGRDRQLPGGRARRRHRRLRRALPVPGRQERRVRLPRGGAGLSRRRLRRAACSRPARSAPRACGCGACSRSPRTPRTGSSSRASAPRDVDALPAQRQALYNWRRGSKVFLKRI